jgi:hypothetical protein
VTEVEQQMVDFIRAVEGEYRAELRRMPESAKSAKNYWYAHAVCKASMCRVLWLRIYRRATGGESCATPEVLRA